jgi:acyl-CoA thioesterase
LGNLGILFRLPAIRKEDAVLPSERAAADLAHIRRQFETSPFAASSGMKLVELTPGFAKTSLEIEKRHLNSLGMVHGGAIFTLADFALGAAVNSRGVAATAISANISFLKAARSGALFAEATEISRSRKLSVCTVRVTNDASDLIAMFQGTAYLKDEPPPPDPAAEPRW